MARAVFTENLVRGVVFGVVFGADLCRDFLHRTRKLNGNECVKAGAANAELFGNRFDTK